MEKNQQHEHPDNEPHVVNPIWNRIHKPKYNASVSRKQVSAAVSQPYIRHTPAGDGQELLPLAHKFDDMEDNVP
jgi:hypothetical protein